LEVTVVLPTRDRWALAREALRSALAQQNVSVEVCVVDDGSVDPAPADFSADTRVRLFRHETPRGVAASRNRGVSEARADWIAFLDDDDLWAPSHLEHLLAAVLADKTEWAFSRFVYTDIERTPGDVGPVPCIENDYQRQFLRLNPIGTPSCVIVSTEMVRRVGGFDEQLSVMADWDLWVRLAALAPPTSSTELSVGYAQHAGNMSLDIDRVRQEMAYIAVRHRDLLGRLGVRFADNHHFWRWMAVRYAAQRRRLMAARFYLKAALNGRCRRDVFRAIGMIPVIGWPVVARRKILGVARRRAYSGMPPSGDYLWLQVPEADPAAPSSEPLPGVESSHR